MVYNTYMLTLQDLYHDPRVLEPDPSLTAIACIQLALETFGIQVQTFRSCRFLWLFFFPMLLFND